MEKVIKNKGNKLCVKLKGYNNSFNNCVDKKDVVKMSEYFPKPKYLGANVKVELDLSNHATKSDSKNTAVVDTSDLAKKN